MLLTTLLQLPSSKRLSAVYAGAMDIQLLSENLMKSAIQLQRLAINTEIVALKTSGSGMPFTVIAREVSELANTITQEISSLSHSGSQLAGYAIGSAANARLCEKYLQAVEHGLAGENQTLVTRTRDMRGKKLLQTLHSLKSGLSAALNSAKDLSRLSVHLPVVATMFRIESARGGKLTSTLFEGMNAELLKFVSAFNKELEALVHNTTQTLELFSSDSEGVAL